MTACRSYSFPHGTRPRRAALSRHLPHAIGLARQNTRALVLARNARSSGFRPESPGPHPMGPSFKALKESTGHRGAGKNRQEDLDWASRTASEEQMTPSVTRGDATGRHADSTNSPICPAECSAGHAGTGNGLLAVARTRKAANGPLPGNHTGGSEHCQCHDTARRCRAPDARANKKRPPKRAPVQSGTSEGIKLRGWGPGRHPAGSHPRPCRRPQ